MLAALAADFTAGGVQVAVLFDSSGPQQPVSLPDHCLVVEVRTPEEEQSAFDALAAQCDWSVVIAPEFAGHLARRCRRVERLGGRLLGPSAESVELAADKHALAERWISAGVPAPQGIALDPYEPPPRGFPYPAVVKPRFGAGSQGVRFAADGRSAARFVAAIAGPCRLERFCPGLAASVSFLAGPAGVFALPPCRQSLRGSLETEAIRVSGLPLGDDDRFAYLGGSLPLEPALAERAVCLARRALSVLPSLRGYLGVDLVLGDDPEGREDVVIEINPRLTTSYVGLRVATESGVNLAAEMLAAAEGRRPRLRFRPTPIEFRASGEILLPSPAPEPGT